MNRLFLRVGILLLSALVFSCVGVTLLTRFVPANQLQLDHWILLFTVCALVSVPMGILIPAGKKREGSPVQGMDKQEDQPEENAPEQGQAEPEVQPEQPTLAQLAAGIYLEQIERLPPLADAQSILAYSMLLFPKGHLMRHHLWANEKSLVLFPDGEEIGDLGSSLQDIELFRSLLRPLWIARGSIQFYAPLEALDGMDPMVMLRYQDEGDDPALLMLGRASLPLIEALLPGYNLDTRLQKQYPSSHRQIDDIRLQLQELKELWLHELITEKEYADKKAELLVKL